jgi:alginate O-acetyltransferase complex protein AlgI
VMDLLLFSDVKPLLFSDYGFILGFLPVIFAGFLLTNRYAGWDGAIKFLIAASFGFYGLFGVNLLAFLVASIGVNYVIASYILANRSEPEKAKRAMLGGVILNLGALGYMKYSNFMIDIFNALPMFGSVGYISLPMSVGVSFFTFIQIGYLIDAYNGQLVRHEFARFTLFASFFPCVTAGPLVLQKEFVSQLESPVKNLLDSRRIAVALTLFGIGLFKKVVLAGSIEPYANEIFDGVAEGKLIDPTLAWIGSLAYSLQLYFDFSGYSDMAIGLGLLFAIRLPLNFNSPFQSTNISDYWRNWHMTMTRFFTTYVYTGLAMKGMRFAMMNRVGPVSKFALTAAVPSIVTFLVAGVWHGSGWTFIWYGLLHGVAIATYLAWREFSSVRLPSAIGWFLTMSVACTGLVIFRSPDMATAHTILGNMWNPLSHINPTAVYQSFPEFKYDQAASLVVILGAITLLLPNSQKILHLDWPSSDAKPAEAALDAGLLTWRPRMGTAILTAIGYAIVLTSIGSGTNFLYYNF